MPRRAKARVLSRHEMRQVNLEFPGAVSALQHAATVCGRVGLLRTLHAINNGPLKEIGFEVAELRTAFEDSPRRKKTIKARRQRRFPLPDSDGKAGDMGE